MEQEKQVKQQKVLSTNDQMTIKLLASYVPKLIVKQFQENPSKVSLPSLTVKNAAIIFADISGFTPLTEKMSKLGPKGIELMSTHLNNFFAKLIGTIHLYGGDIIKFAGDAVMAVWIDEKSESSAKLAQLANLACQTSLALLQNLHNFTVEECVLRLHIGIAAGSLGLVHVGGEKDCVEFLITGDPISEVGDCEKAAKPNEVYVSRKVVELIENEIKFSYNVGGKNKMKKKKLSQCPPEVGCFMLLEVKNPIPPRPADYLPNSYGLDIRPYLTPYIPPAITHRFLEGEKVRTGGIGASNEMRVISVVFVSLEFTIRNTWDEILQLQEAVQAMQKDIFQYDGSVRQFLVDDKGSVMIAVFGTPPNAHEDDASRAVMTAMAIQKSLANLSTPVKSRIGVTTGEAFLGDVGNAERREFAVVGDIVNLSARLMCAAPIGQIYVDEMTYKGALTNPRLSFIILNPIRVKGKTAEINVYRPKPDLIKMILNSDVEHENIKFIGRQKELAQLRKIFEPQTEEKSTYDTIFLEGEAGSGKSSLINELIRQEKNNINFSSKYFRGNAQALEVQTPYFVWSEIGVQLFGLQTYTGTSAIESAPLILIAVQTWFKNQTKDPELLNLIPVLSCVLPFNYENEVSAKLTTDERMKAVGDLFSFALNKSPVRVVILENLQWFDKQSLEYLPIVIKSCPKKNFILSYRPAALIPPEILEVKHLASVVFFEMRFMEIIELVEIFKEQLKLEHISVNLQKYIAERMALYPLPLLAKEIAEQLINKGIVKKDEKGKGFVQLSELVGLETGPTIIPNSLRGIYTSKVDNLTQSQQVVIKIASIIGTQFSVLLLHDILPTKGSELITTKQKLNDDKSDDSTLISEISTKQNETTPLESSELQSQNSNSSTTPPLLQRAPKSIHEAPNQHSEFNWSSIPKKGSRPKMSTSPLVRSAESITTAALPQIDLPDHVKEDSSGSRPISLNVQTEGESDDESTRKTIITHNVKKPSKSEGDRRSSSSRPLSRNEKGNSGKFKTRKTSSLEFDNDMRDAINSKSERKRSSRRPHSAGSRKGGNSSNDSSDQATKEEEESITDKVEPTQLSEDGSEIPNKDQQNKEKEKYNETNITSTEASESPEIKPSETNNTNVETTPTNPTVNSPTNSPNSQISPPTTPTSPITLSSPKMERSPRSPRRTVTTGTMQTSSSTTQLSTSSSTSTQTNETISPTTTIIESSSEGSIITADSSRKLTDSNDASTVTEETGIPIVQSSLASSEPTPPKRPEMSLPLRTMKVRPHIPTSPRVLNFGIIMNSNNSSNNNTSTINSPNNTTNNIQNNRTLSSPPTLEEVIQSQSGKITELTKENNLLKAIIRTLGENKPIPPHLEPIFKNVMTETVASHVNRREVAMMKRPRSRSVSAFRGTVEENENLYSMESPHYNSTEMSSINYSTHLKPSITRDDSLCDVNHGPLLKKQSLRSISGLMNDSTLHHANEKAREELVNSMKQLELILRELTDLDLIEICSAPVDHQRGENNTFYRFKKNIFCEVIRDNILPSWSKKIHEQIAIWYESNLNLAPDNIAKYLAIHWKKAENVKKAIIYYSKAAENLVRMHCYRDATLFLTKATYLHESLTVEKDKVENLNNYIKWHRLLGYCYFNLGEINKCILHATTALELLGERIPTNINIDDLKFPELVQFRSLEKTGTIAATGKKTQQQGKHNKSTKLYLPGQIEEAVRAYHILAQGYVSLSRRSEYVYCTIKAMNYTEQFGAITKEFPNSIGYMIFSAVLCRKIEKVKTYISLGNSFGEGVVFWKKCAYYHSGNAEWKLASDYCAKINNEFETFQGDPKIMEENYLIQSFNCFCQGKLEEGKKCLDLVHKSSAAREDLQMQALVHLLEANMQYSRGNLLPFCDDIDSFNSTFTPGLGYIMDPVSQCFYYGLISLRLFKNNMFSEAYEAAVQVDKIWEITPPLYYFTFLAYYYSILVRILLYKRMLDGKPFKINDSKDPNNKKYLSSLKKSLENFENFSDIFPLARPSYYILAALMVRAGQEHRDLLNKGLNESISYKMDYFTAVIHHWIGLSAGISDSPETVQTNLIHQDSAFNLFLKLNVYENSLIWSSGS